MLINYFSHRDEVERSNRGIFSTLLAFAIIGLLAAFVLSVEKIHLLQNPSAQLSCNVNVFINCATVMKSEQATIVSGIPNSYWGMVGFSAAIAFAVMLLAGAHRSTAKWVFIAAQVIYGAGLLFAYWLFFQSVFVIQVLCPWCLIVTFSTTILFEAMLRYNLRENNFNLHKKYNKPIQGWLRRGYDKLATAVWIALLVFLVLNQFKDGIFG